MTDRVMLFVDYQNVYMTARTLFHERLAPHWEGQINPGALGKLLVERSEYDRTLVGVRVYRGMPSGSKDPKGYGAARAQIAAWKQDPAVTAVTRQLRYPDTWPDTKAEEKGIDVALAVDFVMGAVKGWFDVGIVMSLDTDLKPALETVCKEQHGIRVEVAAWRCEASQERRLSIPGSKLWCHWLDEADYQRVQDEKDYNRGLT